MNLETTYPLRNISRYITACQMNGYGNISTTGLQTQRNNEKQFFIARSETYLAFNIHDTQYRINNFNIILLHVTS
jgi:hypothetical protein